MAQAVERILGKDEVGGSIPPSSSRKHFRPEVLFLLIIIQEIGMIILITGATHTGKTALAQKMLEKYKYPYLSIDHLKMGLIRSGYTELTVEDDRALTPFLWRIVKEMIKTAIENKQNLIVEGCYIPFDWATDFSEEYLRHIRYICLVMSENYINNHFDDITNHANVIEKRLCDNISKDELIADNKHSLEMCKKYNLNYILFDKDYSTDCCFDFTSL